MCLCAAGGGTTGSPRSSTAGHSMAREDRIVREDSAAWKLVKKEEVWDVLVWDEIERYQRSSRMEESGMGWGRDCVHI